MKTSILLAGCFFANFAVSFGQSYGAPIRSASSYYQTDTSTDEVKKPSGVRLVPHDFDSTKLKQDTTVKTFKVGAPKATINGKSKGTITKDALLKAGMLKLSGTGTQGCNIDGFTLEIHYKWRKNCDTGAQPFPMAANSNKFTKQMIRAIKTDSYNLTRTITFYNISWTNAAGEKNNLDNITFTLIGR